MSTSISICHLYPEALNLYGDRGNVLCLQKRLEWRGIACEITAVHQGDSFRASDFDLFFIGGGQDKDQEAIIADLNGSKAAELKAAAADGRSFLCICGGYQMLGQYYETAQGEKLPCLGILDFYTAAGPNRATGNMVFDLAIAEAKARVVGFENHAGRTYLGPGVSPLGQVVCGCGNNGTDGTEGVRAGNVFGTYCHGPLLPKNPDLADALIKATLERKYGISELEPLADNAERQANEAAVAQALGGRR